ncbi:MAG TPA: nucleotidyltransferase domain-containing protein [Gaiellaceae bacterium]|nr:nucleotidyltransferase domain-containing protein [Gaiellaceae bacterium]
MDLSAPYAPFLSTTDARVLSVLAGTTRPLSGREVARLSEMAQTGVWRSLRRLTEHGLLHEQAAGGKTLLYTMNRDHVAADPAVALTRLRQLLIERIREQIERWPLQPIHASIFGSVARRDGDAKSDVDIFVVRPRDVDDEDERWRAQLDALAEAVLRWAGNHAGIADIGEAQVNRLARERPPIVGELERDGIPLVGPAIGELFAGRRG